jgi:hypothetical protein
LIARYGVRLADSWLPKAAARCALFAAEAGPHAGQTRRKAASDEVESMICEFEFEFKLFPESPILHAHILDKNRLDAQTAGYAS